MVAMDCAYDLQTFKSSMVTYLEWPLFLLLKHMKDISIHRLGWPFQLKTFQFVLLSIVAELHHPLLLKFLEGGAEEVQEA
jgi:hypothetical protein